MSGRLAKVAGVGAVGAIGFYLYQAGGSPKVAEKQFERESELSYKTLHISNSYPDDAAKVSSKVRSELPGTAKEAKTEFKLNAEKAGAKFDAAV